MVRPRPLRSALAALIASACTQTVPSAGEFATQDAAIGSDSAGDTATNDSTTADATTTEVSADSASPNCPPGGCEDSNPCTLDTCIGGQCSHAKANDGSSCGSFKACKAGACIDDCGAGFLTLKVSGASGSAQVCAPEYPLWGIGPASPAGLKLSGDDSVQDSLTGLQWQRSTAPTLMNWQDAVSYCDQTLVLGGHSDWRLPSRAELDSLVDFTRSKPAINPAIFPGTAEDRYWSAAQGYGAPGEAWGVDFSIGFLAGELMKNLRAVRCVRGQVASPAFSKRFDVDAAKGTVYDQATKLTWQRATDTSGGRDGQGGRTLMQAMGYCNQLTLAGGGWRLPEVRELRSLIDTIGEPPAIDHVAFPGTPVKGYWSNTVSASVATDYWLVQFVDGYSDVEDVSESHRVRCVR